VGTYLVRRPVVGLARRIGWGRNTLRRPVDRVEAVLVVVLWLASAAIALGCAAYGLSTAQRNLAVSVHQMAESHPTSAMMLDSSTAALGTSAVKTSVRVQYTDQTGATRTGQTDEAVGLDVGTKVAVWLDGHGTLVPPPMTPDDTVIAGVTAGTVTAAGAEALLLVAYMLVVWRTNRAKAMAIDLEWARIAAR
jgi:hypothetical protein